MSGAKKTAVKLSWGVICAPKWAVVFLALAIAFHAGVAGLGTRTTAATSNNSEEESDSRQFAEEELGGHVLGPAPPRGWKAPRANRDVVRSGVRMVRTGAALTGLHAANEHAGRNGMGGPLRC